ncbi:hypothetical protein LTR62_007357 [Meristemomyces frigidus]|uniref:DASH complex subunit DAD2 n=1 Tax=Meristemomyces frigidus TaxID=1508187 RepID=A0AAN7TI97_9PEZI|nr:hypothetical protein LTR62_007357 [Meristemomyces frigidus]
MSYAHRQTTLPSHIRPSSGFANNPSASTQSSALQARINEKKMELENLRQLRDLSGGLAGQMQQLEEKLSTLSNGTEAVAAVLGNWHNVLRAIHMASAKLPKPKDGDADAEAEDGVPLPQTLVRIPIQTAEAMQKEAEVMQNEAEAAAEAGE